MDSQIILLFGSPLVALALAGAVYLIHRAMPRPGPVAGRHRADRGAADAGAHGQPGAVQGGHAIP